MVRLRQLLNLHLQRDSFCTGLQLDPQRKVCRLAVQPCALVVPPGLSPLFCFLSFFVATTGHYNVLQDPVKQRKGKTAWILLGKPGLGLKMGSRRKKYWVSRFIRTTGRKRKWRVIEIHT